MVDPFSLVRIDGSTPIYLPSAAVRAENEALIKAAEARRKVSHGKVFSDFRHLASHIGPGLEKPLETGVPFHLLRSLADQSPIDRIIIDTRIMQMKRMARRAMGRDAVGFAVRHVRDADPDFTVPEGLQALCRQLEDLISRPTAPFHATVRDFFAEAVEEELTIDRKAMVISRDARGRPVKFHLVDGATIRPVPVVVFAEIQKEYAGNPDRRVLSYDEMLWQLSDVSGFDLTQAAYVQLVDAKIVGAWRDSEMSIDITNPSVAINMWGYGRSLLEKSWRTSDAFVKAWMYNVELFRLNYPEAVLAIKGDYDEDGLRAFRRKVLGEGDGQDNNWRLPVIPFADPENSGLEMVKLRDTPRDMMFAEFLSAMINLKTAAYRMHPSMVNWTQDRGGQIVFRGQSSERDAIEQSQEEGFHALLDSLGDWITRAIIAEYHDELRLVWCGLDKETEDARVARAIQKTQGYASVNEVRAELGLGPAPKDPKDPGDFIGGTYLQGWQALQQAQNQQQQAMMGGGQGYDDGDFGKGGGDDHAPPWMQGGDNQDQGQGQQGDDDNADATPDALQPQRGGPQHLRQEAAQVRKAMPRMMTIRVERD